MVRPVVKLGAISFMTDYSVTPAELTRALEDHGFDSFWAGDHSHIPIDARAGGAPIDTRTGALMPPEYWHLMDPFLALTHAAAATDHIGLGTGVCLVTERDPITTAKQVATLDHLSGGRFVFGVGGGWNDQEMRDHGSDPRFRWSVLRERILAMKAIWGDEVAEYHGDHVDFGPMLSWPKPVQKPHPPIFVGGNARNIARVVDYADGWCPGTVNLSDADLERQVSELRSRAAAAGRPRPSVTAFHVHQVDDDFGPESPLRFTRRRWDAHERAGVDRVVVILPPWREQCLRLVEHYAKLIEGSRP